MGEDQGDCCTVLVGEMSAVATNVVGTFSLRSHALSKEWFLMEMVRDEVRIQLIGTDARTGESTVLSEVRSAEYSVDRLESVARQALDEARLDPVHASSGLGLCLKIRIWSAEGLRSCLNLTSGLIGRLSLVSAALDFDPYPADGSGGDQDGIVADGSHMDAGPELVVVLVGDSPLTRAEWTLSTATRDRYTLDEAQVCIAEAIAAGVAKVEGDISLWKPQVGVRLSSDRGGHAALYLSADLVMTIARCGASLDFDPYVA